MFRTTAVILCFAAGVQQTAQANDIVDFFRALSGPSRHVEPAHAHRHREARSGYRGDVHHHDHDVRGVGHERHLGTRYSRPGRQFSNSHLYRYPRTASRSSFSIQFNSGRPAAAYAPAPVYSPAPTLPAPPLPGSFTHLPHQLGQFVTCPVPLETCVEVRNPHEIAPGAVPRVIAVRDPHLGRFRTCVEQLAYVQVWVPPCEPRNVRVSPCRTRIKLDYGRYDVTIESRNDVIEVTYDD